MIRLLTWMLLFTVCSRAAATALLAKMFNIYQLAAKFLKISDQRIIVQTLCTAQYAKNLPHFLNRNKIIYNLFDKLLKSYLESLRAEYQSQLEDLRIFAKAFNFIKFETINQCVASFQHFGQKFYIICEKGCYFVVELQGEGTRVGGFELRRVENQEENWEPRAENMLPRFSDQNPRNGNEEPKKILQYSAPKFIIEAKIKKKRKVRYTEMQIKQQDEQMDSIKHSTTKFQPIQSSAPAPNVTLNPAIASKTSIKVQSAQDIRNTVHSVMVSTVNGESKSKSQSKQKMKRRRMYYKSSNKRVKTGLIESGSGRDAHSNSKSKSNDITFDEKEARKSSLKKIQLNLRKLTESQPKPPGINLMNQTSSYKQLPKHDTHRKTSPNLMIHKPNAPTINILSPNPNFSRQRTYEKL